MIVNYETLGLSRPTSLTTKSISINNLKVTLDDQQLTIETHGPWRGNLSEVISILKELDDGKNKLEE